MIDIQTAILFLGCGQLTFGFLLVLYQRDQEPSQRIPYWATGKIMQGIGSLLLAGRGMIPDFWSMTVANSCLLGGFAYECWAIFRITGRPVSRTLHLASLAGIVLMAACFPFWSLTQRIIAASMVDTIFYALPGWAFLNQRGMRPLLATYLGWSYLAIAGVFVARALWAALLFAPPTIFTSSLVHQVLHVAIYYMLLAGGFGILLLAKENADRQLRASEARFRSYFELPLIGITITSPDKGWLDANAKLCDMLGYTKDELITMTWAELTHPDDLAVDLAQFERVMAGEIDGYDLEKRFIGKDGHTVSTHLALQCVRRPDRSVNYFVVLLDDITERKQTETALQDSEARYQDLYENAPDMYLSVEPQTGRILQCNRTVLRVTGFAKHDLIGRPVFDLYHPDCLDTARQAMHHFMKIGNVHDVELQICRQDGSRISVSLNVTAVRDATGNIVQSRSSWRDITERKRLEEQLQQQATTDGLTGIANRRRFIDLATVEIKRSVRLNHPLAMAIMDLDHFKSINDTYGHVIGDQALIALTRICQGNIREIDLLARFGGDEFVVLFPETTAGEAQAVMERLRLALNAQPIDLRGKPVALTISVGIAGLASESMSLDTLLDHADHALYQAKDAGRNRVVSGECTAALINIPAGACPGSAGVPPAPPSGWPGL
jgi:diguanylate cyclase (GGDEF)-like protein/PAS domain S-box-containing protein